MPPISTIELRQYTLKSGRRDTLIELFEREFVDPLNAAGAYVLGTFRDVDDPDRFVWLRGFETMDERAEALTTFYGGPVWAAHRSAANDTMVDSDNVLLLRARDGQWERGGRSGNDRGFLTATIYYLGNVDPTLFATFFDSALMPQFTRLGAGPSATLVTEGSANNFPRLPVRSNEPVFIWLAYWDDEHQADAFQSRFAAISGWRDRAPEAVLPALMRKPELLRLQSTSARRIG